MPLEVWSLFLQILSLGHASEILGNFSVYFLLQQKYFATILNFCAI